MNITLFKNPLHFYGNRISHLSTDVRLCAAIGGPVLQSLFERHRALLHVTTRLLNECIAVRNIEQVAPIVNPRSIQYLAAQQRLLRRWVHWLQTIQVVLNRKSAIARRAKARYLMRLTETSNPSSPAMEHTPDIDEGRIPTNQLNVVGDCILDLSQEARRRCSCNRTEAIQLSAEYQFLSDRLNVLHDEQLSNWLAVTRQHHLGAADRLIRLASCHFRLARYSKWLRTIKKILRRTYECYPDVICMLETCVSHRSQLISSGWYGSGPSREVDFDSRASSL